MVAVAKAALRQQGLVALDQEGTDPWRLRLIEVERLKVGKPFDMTLPWFADMLQEIGQVPKVALEVS